MPGSTRPVDDTIDDDHNRSIVEQFHRLYYDSAARTWFNTRYRGRQVAKCPLDLWIYQELIDSLRPELIIETGTFAGGSALYLADLCELMGRGHVVTIDVSAEADLPEHARITYLAGSSTAEPIVERVRELLPDTGTVLVSLDSDHSADHVREELRLYSPMVTLGSYVVVEDTNVNGHPVLSTFGPGPMEAVRDFLATTDEFVPDPKLEKFMLTFNPGGHLRRVSPARPG